MKELARSPVWHSRATGSSLRTVCWTACATLVTCALHSASASGQSLEDVRTAWQAREERFQTGVVRWEDVEGTIWEPPGWQEHAHRESLTFDRTRMRYVHEGPVYAFDVDRYCERRFTIVFDGKQPRQLFEGEQAGDYPAGFIRDLDAVLEARHTNIEPLVMAFRPLSPKLNGTDLAGWRMLDKVEGIDGEPCVLYEHQQEFVTDTYWLRCDQEYTLARREMMANGKLVERIEIRYRDDPVWGSLPSTWSYEQRHEPSGKRINSVEARLTEFHFNEPIDQAEFDLKFPPRTRLTDERAGTYAIVRENGEPRLIDPEELGTPGLTYEDLMRTDPPSLVAAPQVADGLCRAGSGRRGPRRGTALETTQTRVKCCRLTGGENVNLAKTKPSI